jgi:hypothetical protein
MRLKSYLKLAIPLALCLLTITFSPHPQSPTHAQDGDPTECLNQVQIATELASATCTGLSINQICYGFGDLTPTFVPTATNPTFATSGDRIPISDLQAIRGASTDWSVALIALQNPASDAPIPTTLALLGDVEITDTNVSTERGLTCPLLNNTPNTVNVRSGTNTNRDVVGSIRPNENVTAIARNQLGDWVQILQDDGVGWVYAPLFETACDVFALPVVDENTVAEAPLAPFQAISLTTPPDNTCPAAPNGLLVYTVFGYPYQLTINGVDLHINGAAYLTASSDNSLNIRALEGEITASTPDNQQFLLPNTTTTVADDDFSDPQRTESNDLVPIMIDVLLNGQSVDTAFAAFQPNIDAENADTMLAPIECHVGDSDAVNLEYSRTLDFDATITAVSDGGISIVLVNQGTAWVQCNREGEFEGRITVTYGDETQETIGLTVSAAPPLPEVDEDGPED